MKIVFAPLQGYTEDAYRRIHNELCGGVDEYYTPFVRLVNGDVRSKDMRDIRPEFNEGVRVTPQVIANGGKELNALLDVILPMGYKTIDINMGCPFPLQTRHGRGAGLLQMADRVEELCKIVRESAEIGFSVKMRLGLSDADEWKAILPILNDTPLRHITIHPRIGEQQYKGDVNRDAFAEFLSMAKHPVIYNGDVKSVDQIRILEREFPQLEGVMIGRGLLARPTLAREYVDGKEMSESERLRIVRSMHDRLMAHYEGVIPSESQRLEKIRTFWDFMEEELGRKTWKKIVKAGNMKNYLAAISQRM